MDLNDTLKEEFNKPDLEYDLINNDTIVSKCIHSEIYCRDLYGALCNNRFFCGDNEWTCSWRMAGGIVADILRNGDYMDWYCSGNESEVTDEIRLDLLRLGWTISPYEPRLKPGVYRNDWGEYKQPK
jgi:hypothetical protein